MLVLFRIGIHRIRTAPHGQRRIRLFWNVYRTQHLSGPCRQGSAYTWWRFVLTRRFVLRCNLWYENFRSGARRGNASGRYVWRHAEQPHRIDSRIWCRSGSHCQGKTPQPANRPRQEPALEESHYRYPRYLSGRTSREVHLQRQGIYSEVFLWIYRTECRWLYLTDFLYPPSLLPAVRPRNTRQLALGFFLQLAYRRVDGSVWQRYQ